MRFCACLYTRSMNSWSPRAKAWKLGMADPIQCISQKSCCSCPPVEGHSICKRPSRFAGSWRVPSLKMRRPYQCVCKRNRLRVLSSQCHSLQNERKAQRLWRRSSTVYAGNRQSSSHSRTWSRRSEGRLWARNDCKWGTAFVMP